MNNYQKFLRFFCACAPGIAIGFWIAQELGFFWPIGAGIGAMISYMLVEWKAIVYAIPEAWDRAISWRPDRFAWKCRGLAGLGFLSIFSSSLIFFIAVMHVLTRNVFLANFPDSSKVIFIISLFICGVSMLWSFLWFLEELGVIPTGNGGIVKHNLPTETQRLMRVIKNGNPLAVFIYWPIKGLFKFVTLVISKFIPFCIEFGNFLKEIIFTIHSQKRVLCATTTFIAVVSGYMLDGDLITFTIAGAVAGGLYSISPWRNWVLVKTQPLASA